MNAFTANFQTKKLLAPPQARAIYHEQSFFLIKNKEKALL